MKASNFAILLTAAAMTAGLSASAANTWLTFSTRTPAGAYKGDVYADGTTVVDGEWYALCWSPNASFGGLTNEGAPQTSGDRVLLSAPLAENGHCPTVVFQLDPATAPTSGNFFVYLLDTRGVSGLPAKAGADGKPALVNGAVATSATAKGSETVGEPIAVTGASAEGAEWGASAVDVAAIGQPVIKSFAISGENAYIKVGNMHPSVRYNVMAGETPADLSTAALELPISAEKNDVEFVVPAAKGKFFKVARQPLK